MVVIRSAHEYYREGLTSRERFTVAHELAHCFVETQFGFKPTSNAEYWRLEEICNGFAAALLAPRRVVDEALCSNPVDAVDLLCAIQELRRRTKLSFAAASRRIIEALQLPATIACLAFASHSRRTSAQLRWVCENRSWIGGGRNRRMSSHPFLAPLAAAEALLVGQVRRFELNSDVRSACVLRGSEDDFYLIALLESSRLPIGQAIASAATARAR
ncbi:ImmA/IrrE family metallo-endopeptidase [Sorangium sp. So ce1389]|uniref:ImmA/IrrE family metallo-endopeptidase n=1 Tax=Sorangium sp. So ce1389 TaxID=3133336 RepID=UPI003F5E1C5D